MTLDERDLRWGKVRAGMAAAGLDCLIIVGNTGLNLYMLADLSYLTGLQREGVLVFPLEGEPVLFSFGGGHGEDGAWVPDHRNGFPSYARAVADIVQDRGYGDFRFGAVLSGYHGDLIFPHRIHQMLHERFPGATISDAHPVLAKARRIKTDHEIRCIEAGCVAGEKAIDAVAARIVPGLSDIELKIELASTLFREGCSSHSLLLFHSGKITMHGAMGGALPAPSGRALEMGDTVNVEFDANFQGYVAQFNQPFFLGEPRGDWIDVFATATESFEAGLASLRPGVTARALQEVMARPIRTRDFRSLAPMFHGLGGSFEAPVAPTGLGTNLPEDLDIVFEPGMVIELEPHVVSASMAHGASLGCPVLVTDEGCRLLAKNWTPAAKVVGGH